MFVDSPEHANQPVCHSESQMYQNSTHFLTIYTYIIQRGSFFNISGYFRLNLRMFRFRPERVDSSLRVGVVFPYPASTLSRAKWYVPWKMMRHLSFDDNC